MNADGFVLLEKLELAEPERRQELKQRIVNCARFARAEREAEEIAMRVFCDTPIRHKPTEADKNKPDAFGILAYLMRRLVLRR